MTYGTTPTGSDTLPLGSVYVPNTSGSNLTPLQGGTSSTDGNGNVSAPVAAQIVNAGVFGDTFSSSTNITAATTFSGIPTISQLVTNSYVTLANPGGQATFVAELAVASAFIGTLSFYELAPDASTLQLINAHQRGTTTVASSSAISTASALTQVWMGSAVTAKSIYVVCTAYTSGTASATLGLSAAPYAQAILNTVTVTGSISASNPSVGTDGSAIPTSSTLLGASDGTNLQQLLVESSSNHNLRTALYSGANEATVTGANALKVDGSAVTQPVQQSDLTATGTLSAAQATQDTPVSNATVSLTLGKGNTSFSVDLRGTFSSGSVVNFDGTINGTNWFSINATPIGSTGDTEVSSVSGGSPLQYQGNASGLQQVRVRCSTYTASDAIAVTLIGSVSSDGGFLSKALPAGTNSIGSVTATQATGSNLHTVVDSGTVTANAGTGTYNVAQADLTTGPTTVSAAQPVIGTPVSNATVSLTLGQGQSSWHAQLVANAGFTAATTFVVDQSIDGGTTWFTSNFKVAGVLQNTTVQSVTGPGPLLLSGDGASKGIIRVRCSVLNTGESVNVLIRSGVGVGNVGLLSSLPAGSNLTGGVNVVDSAGSNKLTVTGTGAAKVDGSAVTQPVSGTVGAVEYAWNGGAVNNQNYDRLRQVQALSAQTASISSGGGVGSLAPVLASATGLQPGQWVLLTGGTAEWVLTANTYTAGSTTLALTSAIVNSGHTTASWNAYSVYGPGAAQFYWESIGVNALALNYNNQGVLAQADSSGNLKVNVATGSVTATIDSTNATHLSNIDTATAASKTDLDTVVTNTGTTATQSTTTATNTTTLAGAVSSGKMQDNLAQIGGSAVVTGGASGLLAIGGPVASGSTNADNPVKVGGAYNSTQPTVTTGQIVDAQYTARGAQIVATGADTFSATVSGTVTANAGTGTMTVGQATGSNLHTVVDSGALTATTNADTTIGGTTAPSKELLIAGKTNDGTPQYQPLPEGAGGRSVIIEGYTGGTAVPVSGTFWQTTQPVSAASLPLPTGAATSAKQPALGTAGTASTDVLSVQGIASMTPIKTDGSGVTQPVSGTVTANAGTNLNTSALALESGGNLATLAGAVTSAKVQSNVAQIGGVAPTLDNTSIQAVSMRGKNSVAGDTPLLVDASGRVYVNVNSLPALAAGTSVVGSVLLQAVSGTALSADQSNTELRVSLYGKNSAAGDTAILTDSTGRQLIGRSTVSVYALASGAQTASGNSGDVTVGNYTEISLDISVTAQSGTTPTLQFFYDRKGSDGVYYPLWQSSQLTSSTTLTATISTSIGAGMAYNQSLGLTGRLRWTIGGTTPSWTFSASIYGK